VVVAVVMAVDALTNDVGECKSGNTHASACSVNACLSSLPLVRTPSSAIRIETVSSPCSRKRGLLTLSATRLHSADDDDDDSS
jgi:hypothetical protein